MPFYFLIHLPNTITAKSSLFSLSLFFYHEIMIKRPITFLYSCQVETQCCTLSIYFFFSKFHTTAIIKPFSYLWPFVFSVQRLNISCSFITSFSYNQCVLQFIFIFELTFLNHFMHQYRSCQKCVVLHFCFFYIFFVEAFVLRTYLKNVCTNHYTKGHFFRLMSAMHLNTRHTQCIM